MNDLPNFLLKDHHLLRSQKYKVIDIIYNLERKNID